MLINKEIVLGYLKEFCHRKFLKYQIHNFDSGAVIVDIWHADSFYVIQIDENFVGFSEVGDNPAFDSTPDEQFTDSELFMKKINIVFGN